MEQQGSLGTALVFVGQGGEQGLPVAAGETLCVGHEWQGDGGGMGLVAVARRQVLEPHRRLSLERRFVCDAEEGGRSVEETADRRGRRGIEVGLPGLADHLAIHDARWRLEVAPGLPQEACRRAPRRMCREIAAGRPEGSEARYAPPCSRCAEKRFATPQRRVVAEADAVPGKYQPSCDAGVLGGERGGMRGMMLYGEDG